MKISFDFFLPDLALFRLMINKRKENTNTHTHQLKLVSHTKNCLVEIELDFTIFVLSIFHSL